MTIPPHKKSQYVFPTDKVRKIYDQHDIIKCHIYLNLTDNDSCSMFFNFICKKECNTKESESRKLIFKISKHSKIRLDLSGKFCKPKRNPKTYFEKFKNRPISNKHKNVRRDKKHKNVRRDTPGINFESYAERIKVLREVDSERVNKKMIRKRLQVKNIEKNMTSVSKIQFANLNDKQYYFFRWNCVFTL